MIPTTTHINQYTINVDTDVHWIVITKPGLLMPTPMWERNYDSPQDLQEKYSAAVQWAEEHSV